MNQTLRLRPCPDTAVPNWARVARVETAAFTGREIAGDRLRAFASRFAPSKETSAEKVSSLAITAGIYAGVLAVAWELSSVNLLALLHALHLNGV
jgi:hypothetical protein